MAPELRLCQAYCTTPALDFWLGGHTPERTGVSTDDHGWAKYTGTIGFGLHSEVNVAETLTAVDFGWWLGYAFTNGQPSDGQYEEVLQFRLLVGAIQTTFSARLYNVSGTYKFRLWNNLDDTQVGSDSVAITVGKLLVTLRADVSGNNLTLFVDGVSKISASQSIAAILTFMAAGAASTGTARYWSAWCNYFSASDNLNEAHYPEMRLLHPDGDGFHTDYDNQQDYTGWDDLASEGDPDGHTTRVEGGDGTKEETSTLTQHTITNTIQGLGILYYLAANDTSKTVVHGSIIRSSSTDKVVSFGSEDIGLDYVVREAVFHTPPDGSSWDQTNDVDALQAGHRRDAGSDVLNMLVTAMGVVVVALGTTNLAPADPPAPPTARPGGAALGSANAMIV